MPREKKIKHIEFIIVGALMMIAGFALMLWPVMAGTRIPATDPRLMTGFITVATGAMLLTKCGVAVFFYYLYVISFLIFQIKHHGILSLGTLSLFAMLAIGVILMKALKRRRI